MHYREDAESGRRYDEVIIRSIDYEQIAIDCFRYFDFKNLIEVDKLTIPEYKMLVKAYEYKTVDRKLYMSFWLSFYIFLNVRKALFYRLYGHFAFVVNLTYLGLSSYIFSIKRG